MRHSHCECHLKFYNQLHQLERTLSCDFMTLATDCDKSVIHTANAGRQSGRILIALMKLLKFSEKLFVFVLQTLLMMPIRGDRMPLRCWLSRCLSLSDAGAMWQAQCDRSSYKSLHVDEYHSFRFISIHFDSFRLVSKFANNATLA